MKFSIILLFFLGRCINCVGQNNSIEFDGVYIQDSSYQVISLEPNKLNYSHYVTNLLVSFYKSPKRLFTTEYNIVETKNTSKIIVKGLPNVTIQETSLGIFDEIKLGVRYFSDGYKVYETGKALVHLPEKDNEMDGILKMKSVDQVTKEIQFSQSLKYDTIYGLYINNSCYFFKLVDR